MNLMQLKKFTTHVNVMPGFLNTFQQWFTMHGNCCGLLCRKKQALSVAKEYHGNEGCSEEVFPER